VHLFDAPWLVLGPSAAILVLAFVCAQVTDPRATVSMGDKPL